MKKMILLIAATAVSIPAVAAEPSAFYGALGGGAYQIKSDGFDETAPTASILGGFRVSDRVAFEAAYTRLFDATGKAEGIGIKLDGDAWDLSTKLSIPMGSRFSPYGRLGWSYLDLNAVASSEGTSVRVNDYQDAFSWAVGTGYKLNPRLSLDGEYARVLVNRGDFDRMSLNLNYRFGSH